MKNKSKIKPKKKDIETDAVPAEWTEEQNAVYNELIALGIAKDASKQFVSNKPLEEIKININYAKEQKAAGKVKSMGAYLYQSINNDYGVNKARAVAQEEKAAAMKEQERFDAMTPDQREVYLKNLADKQAAREMAEAQQITHNSSDVDKEKQLRRMKEVQEIIKQEKLKQEKLKKRI